MKDENNSYSIVNKVANSSLVIFDLEDYYPKGIRTTLDIAQWLYEGVILKEKEFRDQLKNYNWTQYQDQYVTLYCSQDTILPAWTYTMVALHLAPYAKKTIKGDFEELDKILYQEILSSLDYTIYKDKPLIIKGCSKKPVPINAYIAVAEYLYPFAKSIMYGEACSAVPLFKKTN